MFFNTLCRGLVVGGLNALWRSSSTLRGAAALLCALNAISFVSEMYRLTRPIPWYGYPTHEHAFHTCNARFHAVLSGFSLFIYLIMRRLLEIQHQLFEARQAQKAGLETTEPKKDR